MLATCEIANHNITIFLAVLVNFDFFEKYPRGKLALQVVSCIDFIIVCTTIPFLVPFAAMLHKSAAFHFNLTLLFLKSAINFLLLLVICIILLFYQLGMLAIHASAFLNNLAIVISVLGVYVLLTCGVLLFQLTIERAIATIYIADYEAKKRPIIGVAFIVFDVFCIIPAAFVLLMSFVRHAAIVTIAFIAVFIVVSCIILYLYIRIQKYNSKLVAELSGSALGNKYNLPLRFQAEENVKALNVVYKLFLGLTVLHFAEAAFLIGAFGIFEPDSLEGQIAAAVFELAIASYVPGFMAIVLWSVDDWRTQYCDLWHRMFGIEPNFNYMHKKVKRVSNATRTYFAYFQRQW